MLEEIGTRIADLRKEKGKTQQELADALGVTRSLVKAWETGARPIRCDDLVNLSRYFGVSSDYLLGLIGEDNATDNEKLRQVCEYTGLSNEAITNISALRYERPTIDPLNGFFERPDYWLDISRFLEYAVSSLRVHKSEGAANNIDRLSVVQATLSELGGGQIMLGDKPLHIPKGTVLLSAQNASDYYKAKAAQVFSDFLDGYIDEACSGRG